MSKGKSCPECGARGRKTELDEERRAIIESLHTAAETYSGLDGNAVRYGVNLALRVITKRIEGGS